MAISRLCSIPDCGKRHEARGFCQKHYIRLMKFGSPYGGGTFEGEPMQWIEDHKGFDGRECLIWPYAIQGNGYSIIKIGKRNIGAYRLMCIKVHGEPPSPKHEASHSCGNRKCVNPTHLRWDTRAGNQADRLAHGTHNRGSRSKFAKLTPDDVIRIRELYGTMKQVDLAEMFGVSRSTVRGIAARAHWAWV